MNNIVLSPEQEAEALRIAAIIAKRAQEETLLIVRIMMSKPDAQLLGATEFEVRDRAHNLAAFAMQTVLNERKKGATKVRA
jgi:hypothetical protein